MTKKTRSAPRRTSYQIAADLVMLPNKTLRNVDVDGDGKVDGYQFDIANPFYTGEPVSSVRNLNVSVDGERIGSDKMSFVLRGQRIGIKDVPTLYELLWGFGEVASVYVAKPGGLKKGSHKVECMLILRPSAGDYGFGDMEFPKKTTMITR